MKKATAGKIKKTPQKEAYVILHNVRSIHNVGSIFRTSDAVGVSKIFLTGYTPTPHDRFGRVRGDVAKVALGAEKSVAWEYCKSLPVLLKRLRAEGVQVVAIEQSPRAVNYRKVKIELPSAFLYGNEVEGVAPAILWGCDVVAEIPMSGRKESLNVSVSAGITLFAMLNK